MNDLLTILVLIVIVASLMFRVHAANQRAAAAEIRERTYREICDRQAEAMKRQSEGTDALMASLATVQEQRDRFLEQLVGQR